MGPPPQKMSRAQVKVDSSRHVEFGVDNQIHPLLIDHVLEQILTILYENTADRRKHLIPHDLKSCRLVCKSWHRIATKVNRKLCLVGIDLSNQTAMVSSINTRGLDWNRFLSRFMTAFRQTRILPFANFRMYPNLFVKENEDLFLEFLAVCGPFVKNLRIGFGKNFTMAFHDEDKFNRDSVSLPELSELKVHCFYVSTRTSGNFSIPEENQIKGIQNLVELLLSSASDKLKSLYLGVPKGHFPTSDSGTTRFGEIAAKFMGKNVTSLNLVADISDNDVELLERKGLTLKMLHINFYGSSITSESVLRFLACQRDSLKNLGIADVGNKAYDGLEFPILSRLTKLDMKGRNDSAFNSSYVKYFPALENLVLRNRTAAAVATDLALDEITVESGHSSLKRLHLDDVAKVALIQRAAKCFPNLKSLQLKIDAASSATLTEVFDKMPSLEELDIYFPVFFANLQADSIFTGFSSQFCKELLHTRDFEKNLSGLDRKPSLICMKNLRTLKIESESYAVEISDATGSLLLGMQNLRKLTTRQHNISTDYFNQLTQLLDVTVLKAYKEDEVHASSSYFIKKWSMLDGL